MPSPAAPPPPSDERVLAFQSLVQAGGVALPRPMARRRQIAAACGQLARRG